jgi:phage shock protein A
MREELKQATSTMEQYVVRIRQLEEELKDSSRKVHKNTCI